MDRDPVGLGVCSVWVQEIIKDPPEESDIKNILTKREIMGVAQDDGSLSPSSGDGSEIIIQAHGNGKNEVMARTTSDIEDFLGAREYPDLLRGAMSGPHPGAI